jgi:protein TonB
MHTRILGDGITHVSFQITTEGSVKNVVVTQSSGSEELDQAAIECTGSWTYRPAQKDGHPIEIAWRADVNWTLQ